MGLEPWRFGGGVLLAADVGAVNDARQAMERRVLELAFADQHLEGTQAVVVGKLQLRVAGHIERHRFVLRGQGQHLLLGNEQELCLRINEAPDEPRASHAIHFDVFSRNPLHGSSPCCNSGWRCNRSLWRRALQA
jgi:hypothetical protein